MIFFTLKKKKSFQCKSAYLNWNSFDGKHKPLEFTEHQGDYLTVKTHNAENT